VTPENASDDGVRAGIRSAFARLQEQYRALGGWRYSGSLPAEEGYGYLGPWAWSEGDYQYKFARLLEDEPGFRGHVHIEVPLRPAFRSGLDLSPGALGTSHVDIVVTDFTDTLPDATVDAGDLLRDHCHSAFIEAKWFLKSAPRWRNINWRAFERGVRSDIQRLSKQQKNGWCQVAAMLVVDDWGWHAWRMWTEWADVDLPPNVEYLVLVPPCPACESFSIHPIVWGFPDHEIERRAQQGRFVLGGCLVNGDGSDPTWQCNSCGNEWNPPGIPGPRIPSPRRTLEPPP